MAGEASRRVAISLEITDKYTDKLKNLAKTIREVTRASYGLQHALSHLGGENGASLKFSPDKLVDTFQSVKRAADSIRNAGFSDISKVLDSFNSTKLTEFAQAINQIKNNLDANLTQQLSSLGQSISTLGTAQTQFNGTRLANEVQTLLSTLSGMSLDSKQTQNISDLKTALAGLSVPLSSNTIDALSKLGYALRNIKDYAEGKNVLSSLSTGVKQFAKLKEVDGFVHNVQKMASAAIILNRAEAIDFTRFVNGLSKVKDLKTTLSKDDWQQISEAVKHIQRAFAPLDKMKLPNLSGLATAVATLTAKENGRVVHDMELFGTQIHAAAGHILEAFTPLKQLKMPQLGGIAKNLDTLSTATYNFKNIEAIVARFKQTLGTLHGIQLPNLNNFAKGLNELQKLKTGVSVRGSLGDDIKSLKTDLMGWEHIKVPNLLPFVKGLQELSAGRLDTKQISENLSAIPKKLRWLTGIQVPDLSGFAKGIHELSKPTVDAGKAASAIGTAIDAIHTKLAGKAEVKFPSLATFAKGIKEFHLLAESGKTDEQNIDRIITPIKKLISALHGTETISLPNINGIAAGIHKLSTAVPVNAGEVAAGHIDAIVASVKKLDGIKVPNINDIANAFTTLNKAYVNYYTSSATGEYGSNIEHATKAIKKAIVDLSSLSNVRIPNLNNVASAFSILNNTEVKGKFFSVDHQQWFTNFEYAIAYIKKAILDLKEVSKITLPNLNNLATGFKSLDAVVPKGKKPEDINKFTERIEQIKEGVAKFRDVQDINVPNITHVAKAFRELDSAVPSNLRGRTGESYIDKNIDSMVRAIRSLGTVSNVQIPNIKGFADAFKIFNTEYLNVIGGKGIDDYGNAIGRVERIKSNIRALYDALTQDNLNWDKIKLPNVKNIADAFKILNDDVLKYSSKNLDKGVYNDGSGKSGITRIKENLKALRDAIVSADFSGIRLPNVKNVADAFKTLNSIEELKLVGSTNQTRVSAYVGALASAIAEANTMLKDVKLPNAKNLSDAFKTLNSITIKDLDASNFSKNFNAIRDKLKEFNTDKDLQGIKIPNLKNLSDAFRTLNKITVPEGQTDRYAVFNSSIEEIKKAIRSIGSLEITKLPNLKNIADAFKIFNESVLVGWNTPGKGATTRVQQNVDEIIQALTKIKDTEVIKLPNLKNIADAFNILGTIPKGISQDNRIDTFKTNINAIVDTLHETKDKLNKIQLPNLKNIADGFAGLSGDRLLGTKKLDFIDNVNQVKWAIEQLSKVCTDAQGKQFKLPNLEGIAKAFKVLNSEELKGSQNTFMFGQGGTASSAITRIKENVRAIVEALREFEGKNFDLPNINNLAAGLQKLNKISEINGNLSENMGKLKEGLEVLRGVQVPKQFKNFADGLHSLQEFSTKATGQLINDKLAQDLAALATSLRQFTGITLPTNLQGFAKGIEAVAKVNVQDFTTKFNQLMQAMKSLNLDPNTTALDHLTAKLAVCAAGIYAVENKLRQASASFAGFGGSTKPAEDGLSRLQERIKMFLQYRVISTLFNKLTTAIQAIPNNIKEFEKSMYNVQSITGATDVTVSKLGITVKEIASTTKFSAQEVADGMTMIAQAGFTAGQSMQMMQSISNLATGTLSDMKTVVDLVTSAMVVFNIESNDAARVSDVFANAVNKSKLTMDKIKTAFNYIGPVARDANVSFEESAVAMMLLANSGQKASTIGTGLRNVFATLLSPSKKLTEAAAAVGVSLTDLDPRVNSFKDVISNLGIVVRDSQVALDVFGKRGSTAVLSLTNGAKDFDRLYSAVTRVGSAAEMASKQQEGLYVRWKNLTDRAQLLAVTLGQNGVTGAISALVNAISGLINWLNSWNNNWVGRTLLRFGMLSAALTSFAAVIISVRAIWAPFVTAMTNGMINLVGLFPKVSAGAKTAAAGIAATSAAAQAGTAATVTFGTALRALLAAAWPLIAVFTTLSFVFSAASVDAESVQNRLQNISQELDKIENQTHSLQAALDKIAKTREGTSEYANAIKSLMQALLENKGAVVGAEDEFRALQRSINDTSDGFNDGGKAVANYMSRLKELAAVQANMASADSAKLLRKVMPRARDMAYDVRKELGLEVEYKRTGNATLGQIIREDEVTFDQIKEIVRKVSEGIWSAEQVGIRDWSKFIDRYKTARENAEKFIDKYKDMGKLSLYDTIENVQTLARNLNKTEDEVKAILSVFKEMQDVEFGKNFSGVLPSDVQNAMRNLPEVELDIKANLDVDATKISEELDKIKIPSDAIFAAITAAREDLAVVSKENKTNINYTDDDVKKATQITERFRQISEYAKKFKEEYQSAMAKTASISDVTERERRRYELQQKSLVVQKALRIETDKVMVARNESENVAALTRGLEVQLEKQRELASIEQRIADIRSRGAEQHRVELEQITKLNREIAATDDKSERTKLEGDVAKLQERIRDRARANQKEIADLEAQSATILEKYFERYSALTRAGEPVEEFVKKLLKADKEEQKIRDIQLQRDLNRIHILEEAYKQSNGRIGLDFKQSRAAEQEAFAKDLASKLVAIDNMEKKIKAKYSLSTNEKQAEQYAEQLRIIQQQRDKALEDAYKNQFDLQQKYAKAAMFAAKEAGDKIEKEAKRASEARKREQEKAMHDIALLEAKGVISHEEAERQKAEVSIKSHGELIAAYRKQIEDLKNVGAADNIQQIVRLEEEIAKSSYDAIKEARKGIEEQNKSIYESIKKLEEIQGSKDLDRGAGDFSLERQRKITEEYAEEIEKRKKFEKEGVDYVTEVQYDSMSKVAEAVRKHYDKVDSIRSKSAEKQETLEKDMVKKQEEYEKKKFDIKQKYNKKEVDLANERQDVLDQLETDGDSKRLSRRKLYRANERIANAENQINEATAAGDKQTLEAIANQLKSDTGTLLGAEKPRVHGGAILRAFELRKQILAAQKQIELAEEEKKFQRELERDKRRLSILKDSAEQALLAENGRHELAMEHLEKEAEKMREKIRLAQELIKLQKEALEDAKVQLEAQPITGKPSESAESNDPQAITKREDGKYANVPPVLGTKMEEKGEKKFVPKQPIQQTPAQQVPVQGKGALPTNMPGTLQHAITQAIAGAPGLSNEQKGPIIAQVTSIFGAIEEKANSTVVTVKEATTGTAIAVQEAVEKSAESAKTALTTVQEKAKEAKEAKEDADITKEKAATHLSDSSKERVNASDPAKMAEAAKKAGLQVTAEGVATNLYNPEEAKKSAEEVAKIDADFRERVKQAADRMNEDNKKAAEGFEQDFKIAVDSVSNLIGLLEGRVQDVQQYVKDNPIVFVSNAEESQARIDDVFELITQYINDKFDSINVPIGIDEDSAKKGIEFLREDVTYLVRDAYKLVVEGKVDDAIRKLQGIKAELDKLKDKEITVTVEKVEKNSTGGTVPAYSTGGQVYRRLQSRFINTGSGNKDDVPALLMKNEFVHRAAAVKKYGVDFMYKLNNLQIPASITKMFASGGLVSNAVGAVHKFANGGLIRSTKRKLEELFAGSGVNLNVDNLNITGKMEEAANQFTSPIGIQAMGMLAKNIESGIAKFVVGGPISNAALTSAQIRNISAAYSSSIAKAQASGNAAIAQAMTEERKRLYDLSDELQAILASLNEEYNTEARKLTDEHKQKLKEKKEEYDKNVEEENTSYNEKVESDTKSYEKEDKDYAKSKSERDTNYQESLQELKDSLEKDRLDYEANLLSKQQAVLEREAAIQNFRNQLNSERYPVGSSQHSSASIEELIYAHAEYAKKKYGSDRMYIIDMGGTISQPNLSDEEKKAELQRLKEAIRPMSRGQRDSLNRAYTKAYNSEPRYFYDYLKQADNLKAFYNKERGYTAYREAAARAEGELEEIPMEQSIPYYTYLMQHLRSDYTLPMQQAALELQSAMTEDTPDTKVTKEINKLTKEYKEATDEAEESRIESLEERKKNIAERETSHKDKLAELKKDYDDFVAEENKTYQESLAKLKEETETKVEDAKAGNYENIEIVKNNTADIIEYAKTKMRRSVAAARSDKERWLNNVQNASREQANKNAADALSTANAYVPEYVSTEPKTGNAMSVAQGLLGGVDIDELLKKLRNGVLKFAKGGLVPLFRGAKAGTDSVLSLLSPHEFVMSAKAVKAFGVNFMNSLNNLKVPAFATGGMVGASTPVSESAIDKIVNKTVYALDLTLNNTHIGELMGEKDTIDSFMTAMNRARMGIA